MTDAVLKLSDLLPMDRLAVTVRDAIGEGLGKRGATPGWTLGRNSTSAPPLRALDINVLDAIALSWASVEEVRRAAGEAAPGSVTSLLLGAHELTASFSLAVNFKIGEFAALTLPFEIVVKAAFEAAQIELRDGGITAVSRVSALLEAEVAYHGVVLASPLKPRRWTMPGRAEFRPPIKIPHTKSNGRESNP